MKALQATYTNHRGETALRTFLPVRLWWGVTAFHREYQCFVEVWDLDRNAARDYAMSGFKSGWKEAER